LGRTFDGKNIEAMNFGVNGFPIAIPFAWVGREGRGRRRDAGDCGKDLDTGGAVPLEE
jgi:hypothetical protein